MPAVALTDHGSLAGAVELYKEAGKAGVKPILGCEVYVADDRKAQQKGYAHLTLLAESNEGYANLIKLASAGFLEGYYYKPRVDWELLQSHSKGLIALSGCLSGRVCKALENGNPAEAEKEIARLRDIFGPDSTYLEIQDAGIEIQKRINADMAKLSESTGLPLVATGDVHYLRHEDARAHEALLCIQSGDSLANPNHWRFDTDQFYFKTPGEMAQDFSDYPEAVARTLEIAERCNVSMELGRILLPTYPVPGWPRRVRLSRRALRKRPAKALRIGHAGALRPAQVRAQDDPRDGLRGLLPDRLGLHRIREAKRNRRRPGPRLGGRLPRRLQPRDHRHRPDEVRPPLRALPQPGPQVDAGHRHRLLGPRPRPGHQLRRREVRARPRRADHHLRDDDGASRRTRRGPCARHPLRHRRQDREAHPRGAEGLPRRVPEAGRRAQEGLRRGRDRAPGGRSRTPARGARPPGLDPRGRRRHRRPPADRLRAAAAEGRRPGGRDPVRRWRTSRRSAS